MAHNEATSAQRGRRKPQQRRSGRSFQRSGPPTERAKEYRGVPLLQTADLYSLFAAAKVDGGSTGTGDGGSLGDMPTPQSHSRRSRLANMLGQGDEAHRYKLASQLVQDAIEGRSASIKKHRKARSATLRRFLNHWAYRYSILAVTFSLMAVTPLEGRAFSDDDTPAVVVAAEALILVLCVVDIALNWRAYGHRLYMGDKKWQTSFLIITALCWTDWFLSYPLNLHEHMFRFSRPLRPFLPIAKKKTLRRLFATMVKALPKMADVLALFAVLVVFFAVIGLQWFASNQTDNLYSDSGDNFESFGAGVLSIFILTTTENFPSIFWPALRSRPYLSIAFFIPALFFFVWLVVPTVVAIVYDTYVAQSTHQARRKQLAAHLALLAAFHILHDDGTARMNFSMFMHFVRILRPSYDKRAVLDIFRVLDTDDTRFLCVREFLKLADVVRVKDRAKLRLKSLSRQRSTRQLRAAADAAGSSSFRAWCRRTMWEPWFAWYRYITLSIGVVCGCSWEHSMQVHYDACYDANGLSGCMDDPLFTLYYATLVGLLMLAFELLVRWGASDGANHEDGLGRPPFWSFKANVFDVCTWAFTLMSTLALMFGASRHLHEDIVDGFEASRGLMVLRIITSFERFIAFVELLGGIVTITVRFAVLYACLTYSFAVVGMALFVDVPSGIADASEYYTFHTFRDATLALTQLTVGNDWNSVLYPNINHSHKLYATFFILYFFMCATLMFNVITGVIIDAYSAALAARKAKKEAELADESGGAAAARRVDLFACCCRGRGSSDKSGNNSQAVAREVSMSVINPAAARALAEGKAAQGQARRGQSSSTITSAVQALSNTDSALPRRLLALRRRLPRITGEDLDALREALPHFEARLVAEAKELAAARHKERGAAFKRGMSVVGRRMRSMASTRHNAMDKLRSMSMPRNGGAAAPPPLQEEEEEDNTADGYDNADDGAQSSTSNSSPPSSQV